MPMKKLGFKHREYELTAAVGNLAVSNCLGKYFECYRPTNKSKMPYFISPLDFHKKSLASPFITTFFTF